MALNAADVATPDIVASRCLRFASSTRAAAARSASSSLLRRASAARAAGVGACGSIPKNSTRDRQKSCPTASSSTELKWFGRGGGAVAGAPLVRSVPDAVLSAADGAAT
eukprot:scaffold199090_cov22-Tisochrysis_lutea.AAC.3